MPEEHHRPTVQQISTHAVTNTSATATLIYPFSGPPPLMRLASYMGVTRA
jgi:hypothetical protein